MGPRPGLVAILAFAACLDAAALSAEPEQERQAPAAADLVRARCIFCHGPAVLVAFSRRLLDRGGPAELDRFLIGHHAPDAAARAEIVKLLSGGRGK